MTTAFTLLSQRCGLSLREAANFLGVRIDTVKSWSSGRNPAPAGVIDELRRLYGRIEGAAEAAIQQIEDVATDAGQPETVEMGISADDHEAQSLGWPCVGAHAAVIGLVAAWADVPIVIVPRGSTVATAGAADANTP